MATALAPRCRSAVRADGGSVPVCRRARQTDGPKGSESVASLKVPSPARPGILLVTIIVGTYYSREPRQVLVCKSILGPSFKPHLRGFQLSWRWQRGESKPCDEVREAALAPASTGLAFLDSSAAPDIVVSRHVSTIG